MQWGVLAALGLPGGKREKRQPARCWMRARVFGLPRGKTSGRGVRSGGERAGGVMNSPRYGGGRRAAGCCRRLVEQTGARRVFGLPAG